MSTVKIDKITEIVTELKAVLQTSRKPIKIKISFEDEIDCIAATTKLIDPSKMENSFMVGKMENSNTQFTSLMLATGDEIDFRFIDKK